MAERTEAKIRIARQQLLTAQSRQKSYADRRRRDLEFQVGEHILLKVLPTKGIKRFSLRGKSSPQFIGPFEILERIGSVAYRLALPPSLDRVHNVFHVSMLRTYISDSSYVISPSAIELREDMSFEETPMRILAREDKRLRNRTIPYVNVQWKSHEECKATWEQESAIKERYPELLSGAFV